MHGRTWTPEDRRFIVDNLRKLSRRAIARRLGRSMSSLQCAIRRYKLAIPYVPRCVWEPAILKYYRRGWNDHQISRETGWHTSFVLRKRVALGLPGIFRNHKWKNKLIQLHSEGLSDRQLAFALDITYSTARERRYRLDLRPNRKTLDLPAVPFLYRKGVEQEYRRIRSLVHPDCPERRSKVKCRDAPSRNSYQQKIS